MTEPNPQQEPVPIKYKDSEGHQYSEVHGDPEQNIEVELNKENEGWYQPNTEGTTPHPFDPELTEQEKERRGQVEEAAAPDSEKSSSSSGSGASETKQASKPNDKSASSGSQNK